MTLVAHRGYSGRAPENTLVAFLLAIAHGYPDVEFDIQLSRDGVPVVIHDEAVDRTTNGTGAVNALTFAELEALDAGSWHSEHFTAHRIPSLLEVLTHLKGIANLHIELKSTEPELAQKVAVLLQETNWLDAALAQTSAQRLHSPLIIISSFHQKQLARSIEALPGTIAHELLVEKVSDESLRWAAAHKVRGYSPNGLDVTPELVRKAHKLHLRVGAWWETPAAQDARSLSHIGGRYAFVDSPHLHHTPTLIERLKPKRPI
jgi:glycerophosphoryl diester phosphodiesterase